MAYPISDVPRRIVYSGSAGVGPYAFTFEVLAATDIAVYKNATLLTLTTDYTVSINTGTGTGTVTLVVAATGSDTVTIVGDRAIQRTSDFVTGGDLFANTLNDELDAQTIYAQQIDEKADRAIKSRVTDPTTLDMTLPAAASRANKLLGFTAGGQPTISTRTIAEVDAAVSSFVNATGNNAASILYDPPGITGTAQAGASAAITLASGASASDDAYNGYRIEITGGTGSGQVRTISDYVGSTKVATVSAAWVTTPDATSVYNLSLSTTVQAKLREFVSVKDFGAVGDGVANDAGAFELAVIAALASGRAVYFPPGDYNINTAKSFTYTGDLRLFGPGASLLLTAGSPVALSFGATAGATTTLAAAVTDGDRSITVTSAAGISEGQLIYLSTNTAVDSVYSYKKQAVFLVSNVSGTTIYLSEPSNFSFTTAETTVTTSQPASLFVDGVNIKQNGADKRFDLFKLQNPRLENLTVEGYGEFLGDVIFVNACHNVFGRNLRLIKGRYTINASTGSRNLFFDDIFAKDCRHPIDCNTWTFNTRIRRLTGINTQIAIQSHPCFEVHFEDCTDFSESSPAGGIGLRCIGGSAKRIKTSNINGTAVNDVQGAFLLSAYQYLGQKYDRVYEDIESNTAILSASDVRALFIRNCNVPSIFVDGANRLGRVSIDTKTVTTNTMTLRRIRVLSPDPEVFIESPPETFASLNTIKDITGITQANPAVVTAVAHGYSNGDLIRIDGVVGMTQVNERTFTIANVTTDTFELSGEDSTGYTAYTSGGKATLGRLAKTIDPLVTPGLGWYPSLKARALLRKTGATLNPLTAITIPVKVRNGYDIQEDTSRHVLITVRAMSSTDGHVVNKYQAYFFLGSTSGSSISSAQAVVPAISTLTAVVSNLRHHYYTQVAAEGGDPNNDAAIGQYYYSFDVVVTANSTGDRIQYVEVEVDEIRAALT